MLLSTNVPLACPQVASHYFMSSTTNVLIWVTVEDLKTLDYVVLVAFWASVTHIVQHLVSNLWGRILC